MPVNVRNKLPIVLLTPHKGELQHILDKVQSELGLLEAEDHWVIVLDNQKLDQSKNILPKNVTLIEYIGKGGAGYTRNCGLDFITKKFKSPFLLLPIDSDDRLVDEALKTIKQAFVDFDEKMISFGHRKIWPDRTVTIGYDGIYYLEDLLKRYITPCGSTVIKVENSVALSELRFGERIRANDHLFFLGAVKKYKKFRCIRTPTLNYKVGNINSLSGKKYKQIFYKNLALKDFGIKRHKRLILLLYFVYFGVQRYVFRKSI